MTWLDFHKDSEVAAARQDYAKAAELEEKALRSIPRTKIRTFGIIAISAAWLWYKAGQHQEALCVARSALDDQTLPPFAREELEAVVVTVKRMC